MVALRPNFDTRLEWRQPKAFQRYHELIADGELAASLRFEKSCGTLATGEYAQSRWTFKRTGFWSPRVTVREAGAERDAIVFTPQWRGGGELAFESGRRFKLKSVSFWGGEWAFETEDGTEVVSVHGPHGLIHTTGAVSVGLPAGKLPETPVLLLLIWYLRLLMRDDESAAAVTVCCS